MRTDDIAQAFNAIVEEAQRLQSHNLPEDVQSRVKTIISIAKHQNDIRQSGKGSCKAKH
jgi:hypothetical protein